MGWTIGSQATNTNVDLGTLTLDQQNTELSTALNALTTNGIGNPTTLPTPVEVQRGHSDSNDEPGYTYRPTLLTFNNVSPLADPFQIAQRLINKGTTLTQAQGWVDTAFSRQEILVITIQGLSRNPGKERLVYLPLPEFGGLLYLEGYPNHHNG